MTVGLHDRMTSTEVTYSALNNKNERRYIETVNLTEISVELDSSAPCEATEYEINCIVDVIRTIIIISLKRPDTQGKVFTSISTITARVYPINSPVPIDTPG